MIHPDKLYLWPNRNKLINFLMCINPEKKILMSSAKSLNWTLVRWRFSFFRPPNVIAKTMTYKGVSS